MNLSLAKKYLLLLFISLSPFVYGQKLKEWKVQGDIQEHLNINPLRFTNRAQCAADSKKAAKSVFFMLDSVNTGKSFYRFSKITGGDTNVETKLGIEKYRYSVLELTKIISTRLINGTLPLFKANLDKYEDGQLRQSLVDCQAGDCFDLNAIISDTWNSNKETILSNGLFLNSDFLRKKVKDQPRLGCYYIKKFSSLHGHVFSASANKKTAERVAESVTKSNDSIVECSKLSEQQNLKVANYQLDILNLSNKIWNKRGFDFWNSLKVYLTWAFRYSDEAKQLTYPYFNVIRSIALEENLLFIPNGCKSIVPPSCDEKSLNLNSMRQFSQLREQELFRTDFTSQVATGVENDLLNKPIVDVNNDILNFSKFSNANDWAKNFRDKFTKSRGLLKLRFINAVNKTKAMMLNLPASKLKEELKHSLKKSDDSEKLKSEIYYACAEYKVATDNDFSFLTDEVDLLNNKSILDIHSKTLGGEDIMEYIKYFKSISSVVNEFCAEIYSEGYWSEGFPVKREGFTSWYKEITLNKRQPFKTNIIRELSKEINPILTYTFQEEGSYRQKEIICVEGANCSRVLLENIFDMYTSLRYADSLLPTNEIQSPNMLNPYNERVSCKMYDPYSKKRKVIYQFFYDIARAATFGLLPSPVYISTEIKDKQVVSMKTLMEDGKITFDPKVDGYKFKHSLIADLGGLFGIPCAISISKASINPVRYYRFNGVSVGSCSQTRVNNLVVNSSTDISDYSYDSSRCVSCAINLETVVGAAASIEPITRSIYILARGVWNLFKGLRDPYDIPDKWTLDVNDAHNTYRKYGHINNYCFKKLLKGKSCLANSCESSIARNLNSIVKGGIESSFIPKKSGNALVKLSSCEELITINLKNNRRRLCKRNSKFTLSDIVIPESCEIKK